MTMRRLNQFLTGAKSIAGDVCLVKLSVTSQDDSRLDDLPLKILSNSQRQLQEEVSAAVRKSLGPEFEVRSLTIGRGSIEILVLVGTVYHVISSYKDFIESMELMLRQVKEAVRNYFESTVPIRATVNGSWTPVGEIIPSSPPIGEAGVGVNRIVIWYLIISHASMLAVLLWLLIGIIKH
jgi:hypothetical protein